MPLPTLHTERLILRPFNSDDALRVQLLAGAVEVAATTLNVPHPYLDGMAEQWIATHEEQFAKDKNLCLAIAMRDDRILVGCINIAISRRHDHCELGYWVGRDFWGNGFCTEAAREMVRYGFADLKLHRIIAHHLAINPASGRVMEKIGMKREGYFREHTKKDGVYRDIVSYGILNHEAV